MITTINQIFKHSSLVLIFVLPWFLGSCSNRPLRPIERAPSNQFPSQARLRLVFPVLPLTQPAANIQYTAGSTPDQPPQPAANIFARSVTPEMVQSCLKEACGPAEELWSPNRMLYRPGFQRKTPSAEAREFWNNEVYERVRRILQKKAELKLVEAESDKSSILSGERPDPNLPLRATIQFIRILNFFDQYTEYVASRRATDFYRIQEASFLRVYGNLYSSEDQLTIRRIYAQILLPYVVMVSSFHQVESPLQQVFRLVYPTFTLLDAQRADASILLSKLIQFRQYFPEYSVNVFTSSIRPLIEKAHRGQDLNETESNEYFEARTALYFYTAIYEDSEIFQGLMRIPMDFDRARITYQEGLMEEDLQRARDNLREVPLAVERISKECQMKISTSFELNTSSLRVKNALESISAVKDAAKQVAQRYLISVSQDNREAFERKIDQIEFLPPQTNEVKRHILLGALTRDERDNTIRDELNRKDLPEQRQNALYSVIQRGPQQDRLTEFMDTEILKACRSLPTSTVTDAAVSSLGKIHMSWFSANYPEFGTAIFAHEIGHVVQFELRRMQLQFHQLPNYLNSFRCVQNRNPYQTETTPQNYVSTWADEDWADHFSTLVMLELKQRGSRFSSGKNMACGLIQSSESKGYLNQSFDPPTEGPHSSVPLRVLLIGHDQGTLPEVCRPLLDLRVPRQMSCP